MRVDETDFSQTAYNHLALNLAILSLLNKRNSTKLVELDTAVVLGNDRRVSCSVGSHTTGVERTESKLCTGLTDSLRCYDAYSLAFLHHAAGSQVASVTLHADTLLAFACEHRTNLNALYRAVLNGLRNRFSNLFTGSNDKFAGRRMYNVVNGNTAENTLIERRYNLITVLQCRTNKTTERTAILLGNNNVMRYVNKTTG